MKDAFDFETLHHAPLTVPPTSLSAYQTANVWKEFTTINGVNISTSIEEVIENRNTQIEYYRLDGTPLSDVPPTPGLYVAKQGDRSKVIVVPVR